MFSWYNTDNNDVFYVGDCANLTASPSISVPFIIWLYTGDNIQMWFLTLKAVQLHYVHNQDSHHQNSAVRIVSALMA